MSSLDDLSMDIMGIGQILKNKRPIVPKNQRAFAWGERNVLDFLQDIEIAMANGMEKTYFLGTIVSISNTAVKNEVVDGQQRLAMTGILLSVIRDHFFDNNEKDDAESINEFLRKRERRSREYVPNIKLSLQDHDYYYKKILLAPDQKDESLQASKESHKRLDQAVLLTKEHVKRIALMPSPRERLLDWVDYLENNVRVVWVGVSDAADAYTIFETLNDRGVDLAVSDLLKNYLFKMSGDRIDEVQNLWVAMTAIIEAAADEEAIVTYIRHYWSSVNGYTRVKELFIAIRNKINSKQSAVDFATNLTETAKLYASIINTDHENWNIYKKNAKDSMVNLNMFGMIQIRPLVLAILNKFSPVEVAKGIRLLEFCAVRFLIVGGLGGGTLEKHYSSCAKKIHDGEIKKANKIISGMGDVVPKDSIFMDRFANATVSKAKFSRYYLSMLEKQKMLDAGIRLEKITNVDSNIVTLEHILPQSPSSAWSHIDSDDIDTFCKRIGNLTILDKKLNSEAGSDGFNDKKKIYKSSDFLLTSSLNSYTHWGKDEIEDRQNKLARLALKVWPYKL